jgi:hypothetical protein
MYSTSDWGHPRTWAAIPDGNYMRAYDVPVVRQFSTFGPIYAPHGQTFRMAYPHSPGLFSYDNRSALQEDLRWRVRQIFLDS